MDAATFQMLQRVARLGSFAGAARQARADPSQVSRLVAAAEAELGIKLFNRNTRNLALTEQGATYLARAAPAFDLLEQAREEAVQGQSRAEGLVRLTASSAFGAEMLVPLLPAMRHALPGIELELLLEDARLDLLQDGVDLAVRHGPRPRGDLICRKLRMTRYLLCAAPELEAPDTPEGLADLPCLRYALPGVPDRWSFRSVGGAVKRVDIAGPLAISNPVAMRAAARMGLGAAVLADWLVAEDIRAGRLRHWLPAYEVTITDFETAAWLLYPSRAYLPRRVRAVIDFLAAHLGDRARQSA